MKTNTDLESSQIGAKANASSSPRVDLRSGNLLDDVENDPKSASNLDWATPSN